jgi:hypothetical protein
VPTCSKNQFPRVDKSLADVYPLVPGVLTAAAVETCLRVLRTVRERTSGQEFVDVPGLMLEAHATMLAYADKLTEGESIADGIEGEVQRDAATGDQD